MKRQIEIFTAGCPVCEPVVQMVRETACQNCEITVYDFTNKADEGDWHSKMKKYAFSRLPAIVVDGQLLSCCENIKITKKQLVAAGIGQG